MTTHKEERREGYVELPHEFVERLTTHVEEETTLFRGLKLAAYAVTLLMAIVAWVLNEKNSDIKAMQQVLNQHSVQINETLVVVKMMLEADRRQQDNLDRLNGHQK
jgi:hypothetical protein